jgi:hypothetical protein
MARFCAGWVMADADAAADTNLILGLYAPLVAALLATEHEPSCQIRAERILALILAGRRPK